jgi:hypothetical protein
MAGDGERRMLFDIRGRRKNVVRVVYAVLALLMGGSLFLTVGPFSIGELFDTGGSSSATAVFDDQAERIEGRLARDPKDEALLLALTRARINAGNAEAGGAAAGEEPQPVSPEAREDFDQAEEAWNRYLNLAGEAPNPTAAQLVAATFFQLAETGSSTFEEIESNIDVAVRAQRIVAEERPNAGSLSALAIYEFFNGNFAAGDKAVKRTIASVPAKGEAKAVEKQLAEFRKNAEQFDQQRKRFAKLQKETGGGEALQNPFEGFGGAGQ